jgi:hypothetical protein
MSSIQEYAQSLAALTAQDFEDEVCARPQDVILDFQTIPATPRATAALTGSRMAARAGTAVMV